MEPEVLVNVSFRLPQLVAMDRETFADKLGPVVREALIAGGDTVHFSTQPYDPDEESS